MRLFEEVSGLFECVDTVCVKDRGSCARCMSWFCGVGVSYVWLR